MAFASKSLVEILNPAKRFKSSPSKTLIPKSPISALSTPSPGSASSGDPSGLSPEQRTRIDINKALAKSKRNRRICTERTEKAKAEGMNHLNLGDLLVEESWLDALPGELHKPYAKSLCRFVECEMRGSAPIYPPPYLIFNALNSTPFDRVKAVIIGQDPYHGPGQAMGLAFSVPEGVKIPSSLVNIFKELRNDVGCSIPASGDLEKWTAQGVLLLNAVLTVRNNQANSLLSQRKTGVVFLLWGNFAQEKARLIDGTKHHILKAAHPSGLSAHRGFFGCKHFSQTNQILEKLGISPIDWQL